MANMNQLYQIIRSKKYFVIHEYLYGVRTTNSYIHHLADLSRHHRCTNYPGAQWLATIETTDGTVKKMADCNSLPAPLEAA